MLTRRSFLGGLAATTATSTLIRGAAAERPASGYFDMHTHLGRPGTAPRY